MMITKRVWLIGVLVVGAGLSVGVATANSFVPHVEDVKDPLGRPSALAKQVIHSASEFDRISAVLEPKHSDLSNRIAVLNGVSDNLGTLVDRSGKLAPLMTKATSGTSQVITFSGPLPKLIGNVTNRSNQAVSTADQLNSAVGGVTDQLEAIVGQERSIDQNLTTLGPKASKIASTLDEIESTASHVRSVAPILKLLKQLGLGG
jgi:methyl-accepting chemotaxis protein